MSRLRLRHDLLAWREVDGELVAVDVHASKYLSANPSGLVLWRSLAHGSTRSDLAQELVRSFGIDHARACVDVDRFVAKLSEQGLLER